MPCPACGGATIAGAIGIPILGTARFSYRLAGYSVDTDLEATMCSKCGAVQLRARDPERISRAHEASKRSEGRR